ncbi:hypothetical protein Prudu_110S000100, partial [Prunus dulcis]
YITLSEYLIVFLSSSSSSLKLKIDRLPLAFKARKRFDFSEQWFLFFPYLIKYKEKETRKLGMVAPQDKSSKEMKSSKKMKFASSSAETNQQARQQYLMIQRLASRTLVSWHAPGSTVDKKWSQIPKDIKEQIWEAVDMAFVVGQGGKKSVLASAAKKWKDFKSTLTRHYILPYTNDKEKLSQPPKIYKFIEKAQWDAFVASKGETRVQSSIVSKGYAGLEDQLEETMPGVEIDRSTLWKRARQDKHGNIPDPKDELQKQVLEGKVRVDGSKDVLTMALGPEHPGRLRGVGAGISPSSISIYPNHRGEERRKKRDEEKEEEKEKEDEEKHDDKVIEVGDYSNMEAPSSLKTLCRYVLTRCFEKANMCSMVGFIDPATVSANSGTIADRSRLVAARLQKTDGEQIFMMPYNSGRHWILLIVRAKKETVYFLDPLPGHRVVDEEAKNIVNSAIKMYNTHIARAGRTPKQPSSVECGYYVMRFMRDIIMDPSLGLRISMPRETRKLHTPKKLLMKSGMNGQRLFAKLLNRGIN